MRKFQIYGVMALLVLGTGIMAPVSGVRSVHAAQPQGRSAAPQLWTEIEESLAAARGGKRTITPRAYRTFRVDLTQLDEVLASAPQEFSTAARARQVEISLPAPSGQIQRFRIEESPIMEPGLAAQFPFIKTYIAQGIDDPTASVRIDRNQFGLHVQVLSAEGSFYIDPYQTNDVENYISYYRNDLARTPGFTCLVEGSDSANRPALSRPEVAIGGTLRTYRLALACTGEYSTAVAAELSMAPSVDVSMSALVSTVNRVVGVYERDLAVRMVLVANNASLIYLNGSSDPYTNNSSALLSQNQTNCNSVIGSANYDVGHVVGTGGGGVAGLGVVCSSSKAQGMTCGLTNTLITDAFQIDYVAHEMGHQFGGNHTFNGTAGSCGGGNRNSSTAYEPGSGSTIQAYAGICGSVDLQPNSDAYFHGISYDEMVTFTQQFGGNGCAAQTATGNNAPVVEAGPAYTIPANTPFALTASGSDPDGDAITYCWEEFDLGVATALNVDNGSSPIFRSVNPTTSPTRHFPRLQGALTGEKIPTTSRTMTFRCTVRDNRAGGGGVNNDSTTVTTTTAAGPFAVTAPNTAVSVAGGSNLNVTWNVASTTAAPVNTANVTIMLSIDGGVSYPIVLLANTPNDGSQTVVVPNKASTTARVMVKGAGNIFYDTSNVNFTITSATTGGDSIGVYDATSGGTFVRNSNSNGNADTTFIYGPAPSSLVELTGDWDGNRTVTPALYDATNGAFFIKNTNGGGAADLIIFFGAGGASLIPIAGDWNGDGVDTIGLYNTADGSFLLRNSNTNGPADVTVFFGGPGLLPVVGDWNGDGVDTVGVYNGTSSTFFLRNANTNGPADVTVNFGPANSVPVVGDWDQNGVDTVGVQVAGSGAWFLKNLNTDGNADITFFFGAPNFKPLIGDWDAL